MISNREYWYRKFPISEKCFYCAKPIDRSNSQRVMRIKDHPTLETIYVMEDICLKCLPGVRANVLSKKGGASIIDKNTNTVYSSNPNHIRGLLDNHNNNQSKP